MSKVSVLEYANMSAAVYQLPNDGSGYANYLSSKYWTEVKGFSPIHLHYNLPLFARLYIRTIAKHVNAAVLAFRGTQPFSHIDNDIDDLEIGVKALPGRYKVASQIYVLANHYTRFHHGVNCNLTGHSLGGALAQLIAAHVKPHPVTVVFNSPGVGGMDGVNPHAHFPYIHNFNSQEGAINKAGTIVGDVTRLDDKEGDKEWGVTKAFAMLGSAGAAPALLEGAKAMYHEHSIATLIKILQHKPNIANERF